jgi:purine-binding chemotaxis protein CheW
MTRPDSESVVLLAVEELKLAFNLEAVERVIRAIEIGVLPDAPRGVLGVINLQGRIIPVFDLRIRFGLPARRVRASDYLVIARMHSRAVAFLVDSVLGVAPAQEVHLTDSSEILPEMECISGVLKADGDLIFVHDLEKFLSNAEYETLQSALSR